MAQSSRRQRPVNSWWTEALQSQRPGSLELPEWLAAVLPGGFSWRPSVFLSQEVGLAAGKAKEGRWRKLWRAPAPPQVTVPPTELNVAAREALGPQHGWDEEEDDPDSNGRDGEVGGRSTILHQARTSFLISSYREAKRHFLGGISVPRGPCPPLLVNEALMGGGGWGKTS